MNGSTWWCTEANSLAIGALRFAAFAAILASSHTRLTPKLIQLAPGFLCSPKTNVRLVQKRPRLPWARNNIWASFLGNNAISAKRDRLK